MLSVLVAFAFAMLLSLGGSAAFASGAGGAGSAAGAAGAGSLGPSSLGSSTTKSSTTTKAPSTTKSAATAKSAGAPSSAKSAKAADTSKSFTSQFSSIVALALASFCGPQDTTSPGRGSVDGFEIDGNTCVDGGAGASDWDTPLGAHVFDGEKDNTAYKQGDAENTDPTTWHTGGSSEGKDDITDAWSYTKVVSGDVWTFFAMHRVKDTGTTTYDVELNHNTDSSDDPARPARSEGDLLLQFEVNGTGPLDFSDGFIWKTNAHFVAGCFSSGPDGGWCPLNTVQPPEFHSAVSEDGLFAEGALNLSALADAQAGQNCTGNFGQMNIRTISSLQHSASLQDFVLPFDVNIPSTCGSIVINKFDEGNTPVGGAHFTISPDPTPGSNDPGPVALVDGGAGDSDGLANGVITINPAQPGDYTVVETQAPTGYLLPADVDQTLTLNSGGGEVATFNFHDPKAWEALTASKTANPTYTAQYAWSVSKEISADGQDPWVSDSSLIDPLIKNVPSNGDPTPSTMSYRVKVTEGARTTSNYKVSGNISVTNPNSSAVTANISDALPGATCLVAGDATHTVAVPSGTTPYAYVCTFVGVPTLAQMSGTNTASVTWDKSTYPQVQADVGVDGDYSVSPTAPYAFGAETTSIDKTVTITDDHHVFLGSFQVTWSAEGNVTTSPVYTIDFSTPAGSCSDVIVNIATMTGSTSGVLGTDSAAGQVCAGGDLTITRIDARGFTRTYPWSVEKSTSTPKITEVNGVAKASYQVTVTAGDATDSGWFMTGTITVHNPNDFESVDVTSLPITYSGGGTCAVTGDVFPYTLAASASHGFTYSCNFNSQPDYSGTISAVANWDKAKANTPNGSTQDDLVITDANWTKTLVNDTITVHDDHANGEDDVVATLNYDDVYAMPNHQQVIEYDVNLANLPDLGDCNDHVNTVWILGDGDAHLDADQNEENNSATVEVCNPAAPTVADAAVGDFTRTYNWKIDKFIDGDQKSQTVTTDDTSVTFDYLVKATPLDAVDTGWTVTGSVTVNNENISPDIDPINVTDVAELLDLGTVSHCDYDKTVPFELASGESATVNFTCTLDPTPDNDGAVPPAYTGSHKGSATIDGSAVESASDDLTWNDPAEVDKTLAVYDNKVTEGDAPVHLGDAVWNADGTPTTFEYELTFPVPDGIEGSCAPPYENLAWLGGDGLTPTDLQSGATATICVPAVIPPAPPQKNPLPPTGGPDGQLLLWGLAMLLSGAGLVLMTSRRRERRS